MIGTFFSLLLFIYRTLSLSFFLFLLFIPIVYLFFIFQLKYNFFRYFYLSLSRSRRVRGICGRKFMWMHFQFPQVITRREVLMIGMNWAWGISNYCLVMLMKEIRFKFLSRSKSLRCCRTHSRICHQFFFCAQLLSISGVCRRKRTQKQSRGRKWKKQW